MADWKQDDQGRSDQRERGLGGKRDWRDGGDWRDKNDRGLLESRYGGEPSQHEPRAFEDRDRDRQNRFRDPGDRNIQQPRDDRQIGYGGREASALTGGGRDADRSYSENENNAFGQMTKGSSDSGLGGYGGAGVGGWGQPNLNSQSGPGGYARLNQGLDYGQDGGGFSPAGYDANAYGPSTRRRGARDETPHDPHHASYHHWRDSQLSGHDRDYANWRDEQARRYDEDYGSWRNERHSAFSKEFEGWRAGRGGQAAAPASAEPAASTGSTPSAAVATPSQGSIYGQSSATSAASGVVGYAHGANPTLARIADGEDGRHPHHTDKTDNAETDKPPPRG